MAWPVLAVRVFLTRRLQDFAIRELEERYDLEIHSGRIPVPKAKLLSRIGDVEGLICHPYDTVDREVIDAAGKLRVISTYSVGFDHIDVARARKRGIRVGYTPEVLTDATADLAFALILDVTRRVTEGDRMIRAGEWVLDGEGDGYVGHDMRSRTLGILGMGRIGGAVAKRAGAFGMDIVYHNRHRVAESAERALGARYVGLEGLIAGSDVISIHVPYTGKTDGMFDAAVFARMKRTAILVNTARGRIVNERDLVSALRRKAIAGAGLDVFETEPIRRNSPLTRMQNVVLAPHIGSSTEETRAKMARITLDNLHRGMAGRRPVYSVGR